MKRLLALLVFIMCVASCGMFGGFKIHTGDLGASYRNQASMNPEKICTPYMLQKVWKSLKDGTYFFLDEGLMSESAEKVLEKAMGGDVKGNNHAGVFHIWAKIDLVARKTNKNRSDLCYAVINGIIKDFKEQDRWASFYDAKEGEKRYGFMVGKNYVGLGFLMKADYKAKRLFVSYVHKGHAADRGGLKIFDEILTIDGKKVKKMDIKKVFYKFRGKKGTKVHLLVARKSKKKPKSFNIYSLHFKRELIPHNDARCNMMGDIAYCKVYSFTKNTVKNFAEGFKNLPGDPDKVIVDFRDNRGGLLYSATHMLNRFWIKGKTLTILVKKKHGFVPFGDDTHKEQLFEGKKVVVLINKASASSTELVVGAIKDYTSAVLMGESTFGKGVSQRTHFILGAVLSYTSMYFLSPHGHIINGNGVAPDIRVKMTLKDFINNDDKQLNAAIKFLKKGR